MPTDRHAALSALNRDAVVALRVHGSGAEHELALDDGRVLIGSAPGCDVVVDDPYVSAEHCLLERRNGERLVVRDQRSKNGTYINGNRVEVAELAVGAILTLGHTGLLALGRRSRHRPPAAAALLGQNDLFLAAVDRAVRAAATSCNVLIVGETGTGKELVARVIHEGSPRALGPFVAVNCGAIAAELVESELFGHEKGAFTGAEVDRDGVFVQADGGTLFLDELGELPRAQQPAFLRALETRTVRRVGGRRERNFDIRLVAATNRLDLDVASSPLRADLYHRVATLVIELPPLRERLDDVPLLVAAFLSELEPEFGRRTIDEATLRALAQHAWPGNVRELRHAVHRAAALSLAQLRIEDLLPRPSLLPAAPPAALSSVLDSVRPSMTLASGVREPQARYGSVARQELQDAYRRYRSVRRAAAALGIPKSTFADRARRLGVIID
ncbi:MAG TPA: sigma 54-interacting transcriptional regulator [Kofleriaceae bacterium]|nr:sigma 54-interacting transcriptional regulator [Kofleriaceae bacterium]